MRWGWVAVALVACNDGSLLWSGSRDVLLALRAEDVRELDFLEEVPVVRRTQAEYEAMAAASVDAIDDARLRELADTYGRLGFFPIDLDVRPSLTESRSFAIGTYSAHDKLITIVGSPEPAVLVHEFVHALQDQHFDLEAYDADTSDAFLARRAVVEGDAKLAEGRYYAEEQGFPGGIEGIDWLQYLESYKDSSEAMLDAPGPAFFKAYVTFAYAYGLAYTRQNLVDSPAAEAWRTEDELFTSRPPRSCAEIMGVGGAPLAVGLDDVPAAFADRLERTGWDVLGAWYLYLLVRPANAYLALSVRGIWRGDRVLFARDRTTGASGVLWTLDLSSADVADRLVDALEQLHEGPEPHVIERRGGRIVVARNFDPAIQMELVEAAFAAPSPAARPAAARPSPLAARLRSLQYPE